MLKAGALLYAVFLTFVISGVSGFMILSSYFYTRYMDNLAKYDQLIVNVNSAMNLIAKQPALLPCGQKKSIDVFGDKESLVDMEKRTWGFFEIVTATSGWNLFRFSRHALFGDDIFSGEPVALYLADQDNYLSLCGKTFISGTCYLPKAGPRRAYIEGQSFSGDRLIDGQIKISDKKLPDINKVILSSVSSLLSGMPGQGDSAVFYEAYRATDTIINSFGNKTLFLQSDSNITLTYKTYKGNIIICSRKFIDILPDAHVEDIIVCAPGVRIKSGFSGKIQVFATDSIIIEKETALVYPSFAGLFIDNSAKSKRQYFTIGERAEVSGAVVLYCKSTQSENTPILHIFEKAVVYGQVYSNSLAEIRGSVFGSMYCTKFILRTASAIYENHLLGATIDFNGLSKYYAGTAMLENSRQKKIIKWLN